MTTYFKKEYTCSICGNKHEYTEIGSYSTFDIRMDGYTGSEYPYMIQKECPYCHHVAGSIEKAVSEDEQTYVLSDAYQKAFTDNRDPQLRKLVEGAKSKEAGNDSMYAYYLWLLAFYYSDEKHLPEEAEYREKAIANLIKAMESGTENLRPDDLCVLTDLLRQSGRFDEALDLASALMRKLDSGDQSQRYMIDVLTYQKKLISEKDTGKKYFRGAN